MYGKDIKEGLFCSTKDPFIGSTQPQLIADCRVVVCLLFGGCHRCGCFNKSLTQFGKFPHNPHETTDPGIDFMELVHTSYSQENKILS